MTDDAKQLGHRRDYVRHVLRRCVPGLWRQWVVDDWVAQVPAELQLGVYRVNLLNKDRVPPFPVVILFDLCAHWGNDKAWADQVVTQVEEWTVERTVPPPPDLVLQASPWSRALGIEVGTRWLDGQEVEVGTRWLDGQEVEVGTRWLDGQEVG